MNPSFVNDAKAIGVLGGTFDPVHFGHLRAAIECANAFALAEVRLMPCNPVHRQAPVASATDRQAMLWRAVDGSAVLSIEEYELQQTCPTYTIDTLRHIRKEIGYTQPLYFILGTDAFNAIETWKEWQALFNEANFVIMHRPGAAMTVENAFIRQRLKHFSGEHQVAGAIYQLDISALDISSTKIRQLIAQHQSIEFLLPKSVESYIQQQGLYQ